MLILGSGNVVHNLRRIAWDQPSEGFDWNRRFAAAATALMRERPGDILELVDHDDFALAVPTPDHFIPLLHIAALAAASDAAADVLVEDYTYGSLSMTSFTVGVDGPPVDHDHAADEMPAPDGAPAEETNL